MTTRTSRRLLWLTFVLVVPLPFYLVVTGWVPPARLLMLGGAALAVIAAEGSQGAVGLLAALVFAQAVLQLALLWGLAWLVARALGSRSRRRTALATMIVVATSLALAASVDLYRTPFRTEGLRGGLLQIFE